MKKTIQEIPHLSCTGCAACMNKCPVEAIMMEKDEEGFFYPQIDSQTCIDCGLCYQICPVNTPKESKVMDCIACYSKDDQIHRESSSGGVFALLARSVLNREGVVYGACLKPNGFVHHTRIDNLDDLQILQGSKYLQSRMGGTYKSVKSDLDLKRAVLFSGTPCQIAGLKSYLGCEHDELLCVEVVCHGVPSEDAFHKFLNDHFAEQNVRCISFRKRMDDHDGQKIVFQSQDHSMICENYKDNLFIKGFLKNYYTRLSCHNCLFKSDHSQADLTIGDFWSVGEFHPEMDRSNGVSAVLIRNEKGWEAIQIIEPELVWTSSSVEKASVWNESLIQSVPISDLRKSYFQKKDQIRFDSLMNALLEKDPGVRTGSRRSLFQRVLMRYKNKS